MAKCEKENNDFIERLKILIGSEKPFSWAHRIGITSATFNRMWHQGVPPKADTAIAIYNATKVSLNWLILGIGDMYADPEEAPPQHTAPSIDTLDPEWTQVPQYRDRLSAGPGSFVQNGGGDHVGSFTFKTSWLQRKCQPKQCAVFHVSGDSMYPMIQDGDVVLVDMAQNDPHEVREGKIYAFSEGNLIRVKRLIYKGSGDLWAISENKQTSPDAPVDLSTFSLIGRVVWIGHEVW